MSGVQHGTKAKPGQSVSVEIVASVAQRSAKPPIWGLARCVLRVTYIVLLQISANKLEQKNKPGSRKILHVSIRVDLYNWPVNPSKKV